MQLLNIYFSVYILIMLPFCIGKDESESSRSNQKVSKAHAIKLYTLF